MKTLNVASARNRFSQLVEEIHESGEGVIVAKYGHPIAMLVPFAPAVPKPPRYPLRGLPYRIADDFDEPLSELESMVAESGPEINCDATGADGRKAAP